MEITRSPFRRSVRGYNFSPASSPATRRNMKTVRFGGNSKSPELHILNLSSTSAKLWKKLSKSLFKAKAPAASVMDHSKSEFENRLFIEIYKSTAASLELGYNPSRSSKY